MPIPTKKEGENQDEFISRCMGDLSDEYDDVSQRYAICISSYENRQTNLLKSEFGKKNDIGKLRNIGKEIAIKKNLFVGEKVSIDFDDTLSTDRGKELAKRLLSEGKDLHIVTRRQERTASKEVYDVAKEVGIDRNKVHFTNGQLKWKTLQRLGIVTHYDNNPDEINAIKVNTTGIRAIKFSMMEFAETSWNDYPESVSNNAKRGIELNEKNGNKCATQTGKVRAQQLAQKEPISEETIKRMYSYLSRAMEYYDENNINACGTISVLLWGGKAGLSYAKSKLDEINKK